MNYYQARQRISDKRWDFTCMNDRRVWPVGYCADWTEYTDADYERLPGLEREVKETLLPHRDKFHGHGHETAEEACRCYRQFLLDTRVRLDLTHPEYQRKCAKCGAWTNAAAEVDHEIFDLCDEHRTREVLEELFPNISSITSSY